MVNENVDVIYKTVDKASPTNKKVDKSFKVLGKSIKMTTAAWSTLAVAAIGAISKFAKFETAMVNVGNLTLASREQVKEMSSELLKLSDTIPQSSTELAKSLFDVVSAGIPAAEAVKFLGVSATLATAGVTDTKTAVDGLTSIINAYGLEASDAMNISDKLFAAQQAGKTTIAELSGVVGQLAPTFRAAGLSIDEMLGGISALTLQGVRTSETIPQLRGAVASIIKPTKDAAKAAEALGINFSVKHLGDIGFVKFMEEVREATGGNIEVMGKLFGNVRALNGVMALANDNFESMAKITGDVATKTGQTSEALSNQADTVNFKFGKLMSNLTNFAIRVGSILAPIAKLFLNVANGILKGFNAVFDAITVHQEEKQEELVTGLQFVVDEIGESQLAVTEVMKEQAELRTANEADEQKKRLALASDLAIKKLAKASEVDKKKKELLKNELALYKGFIKNISDLDRSELEQKIKGLDELKEKNKRNADAIKKIESESSKFREELRRREEKVGTEFLNFFAESVRNRTLSLEEMGKHVGKMIQKQLTARIVAEKAAEVGSLVMKAWGTFGASLLGIPLVIGEAAATIAAINAVQFQDGGIVQPSAGGTPMNIGGTPGIVGEAAQPEVVMPLDQLIDLFPTELILTNENGDTLAKAMWNQQKILQRTGEIT